MKRIIITSIALLLSGSPAYAAVSPFATTGLINTPTADIGRIGQLTASIYSQQQSQGGVLALTVTPNIEVGAARLVTDDPYTVISMKLQVRAEGVLEPGVAIGIDDIGDKRDRSVYVVASKALPYGFRVHAGWGNGRFQGTFFALEKRLTPASPSKTFRPFTVLMAEHDGRSFNYGLRYRAASHIQFDMGWRSHKAYLGMQYNF